MVNANRYSLSTTIWTNDLIRAHRVEANVDVSIIWVHSWVPASLVHAVWWCAEIGYWSRGRGAFPRVLYRTAQCVHQALRA
jgi:hypothetical protein